MSQFVLCEDDFDALFQRWTKENDMDKRSMVVTSHTPRNVVFGSYDAWKTANREDCCEERSYNKTHYMGEFYEAASECFAEEISGVEFDSKEDAYEGFSEAMFSALESWERNYEDEHEM